MDLGTVVASSWSAGISLYAVVAGLGIAGRFEWIETAELLQHPATIIGALVLTVVEIVVDKVAWLDSIWDLVHTVIRPVGAAWLGVLAPDQPLDPAAMAAIGGGMALTSHLAKASVRSIVNTSPEPVSNVVVSTLEDVLVGALLALAIAYPRIAAVATAFLAVASVAVTVLAFLAGRRMWRSARGRLADRREGLSRTGRDR